MNQPPYLKIFTVELLNMVEEIVKMSEKGQLVVPKEIREAAGFDPGTRFVAVPIEDGVVFKQIDLDLRKEYEQLSQKVQHRFETEEISEDVVGEAVEWARSQE